MAFESNIEDMLYNLETYIDDNFGTYITGISTTKSNDMTLSSMKETVIGEAMPYNRRKYPVLLIEPGEIQIEQEALNYDNYTMTVNLILAFSGGNADNNVIKSLRYVEALRQLFNADTTAGGAVDQIDANYEIDYLPTTPGDEKIKVIVFTMIIQKQYTRS